MLPFQRSYQQGRVRGILYLSGITLFGVMKFHHYLYGRQFLVNSDHKPLDHIHKKNLSLAPPRLRAMLMKLSPYDFEIEWKPGEEMVLPDTFSRLSAADHGEIPGLKVRVHSLVDISCSRLEILKTETSRKLLNNLS